MTKEEIIKQIDSLSSDSLKIIKEQSDGVYGIKRKNGTYLTIVVGSKNAQEQADMWNRYNLEEQDYTIERFEISHEKDISK